MEASNSDRYKQDAAVSTALHQDSFASRGGILAMCGKNRTAHKAAVDDYFLKWDNGASEDARERRKVSYTDVTNGYYNLVTDMFEHFFFGDSFHFFRIQRGQPMHAASRQHEAYLASKLNLKPGHKVLDVGSGVGGPARYISKLHGVEVVGLNNNDYQIQRAMRYTADEGLDEQVTFVKGDFMEMPFAPNSFDAAYSIEATSYAPNLKDVYSNIFQALEPGGRLAVYELILTDAYDDEIARHRQLRGRLEKPMGIPSFAKISQAIEALKSVGFELIEAEDLACRDNEVPWWYPFSGSLRRFNSVWDIPRLIWLSLLHTRLVHAVIEFGEKMNIFAPGARRVVETLTQIGRDITQAEQENLFTPIFILVGQKPLI